MALSEVDIDALLKLAWAAGEEILAVYRAGGAVWRKGDDSPLTEADLRADEVIRSGLAQLFAGVPVISEESALESSAASLAQDALILVDPLDGTKEFLQRNDQFTVNIGWIEKGEPIAGVVVAPALGVGYFAVRGLGAFRTSSQGVFPITTQPWHPDKPLRVIASRAHGSDRLTEWLNHLPLAHTLTTAGSSLKFCRIAEGSADLYPRLGPTCQWDTAAAHAILAAAGGIVTDIAGTALRYGVDRPMRNPDFVAAGDPVGLRALLGGEIPPFRVHEPCALRATTPADKVADGLAD